MARDKKLRITYEGDVSDVKRAVSEIEGEHSKLGGALKGVGKVAMAAVAGVATAAIAFGAVGVAKVVEVEKGLREVNTLFGETGPAAEASFAEMSKGVENLSNKIGIAQDTLVGGLYQAISAGVPKENAFTFMEVASKAAIAGVTDTETAVDGLTSIINAFGLSSDQAGAVADSMFTAVKGGKTNFEQLSASIFQIAPAAAAAGVSFQEVNAAIATMTAAGTPTSVATTQMRAALVGLNRPSEEMTKIFKALGFESAQAAIEQKGLGAALQAVKDASGGSAGKLQQLLGSVEAVSAANVLAGTGAQKFAQEVEAQANAAGASVTAFNEMEKSTSRAFEKLKVSVSNAAQSVGAALLPSINALLPAIQPLIPILGDALGGIVKALAPSVEMLATALGPILAETIKVLEPVIGELFGALSEMLVALLPLLPTLAQLLLALVPILPPLTRLISLVLSGLVPVLNVVIKVVAMVVEWIVKLIVFGLEGLIKVAEPVVAMWKRMAEAIGKVVDWVKKLVDGFKNIKLPSWLTPGSPSPFETSLWSTVEAMRALVRITPGEIGFGVPSLRPAHAGITPAAGTETPNIVYNIHPTRQATAHEIAEEISWLGRTRGL